ncbi:MAG: site-specific DNA-methyltransferase [Tepidisphaera sp.]
MNPSNPIKQPDAQTEGSSVNIVDQNIATLRQLFPEAFTESSKEDGPRFKVDIEVLKQLLGGYTEDEPERYSFTWSGKARARRIAQTPSSGTLRPSEDDSLQWESTQHLFVEGDNLEVLKLLQKAYHRQVRMIYIDPPYNTGREFIYPDNYKDNLDTYLRYTGQVNDDGFKVSANSETSGRYHTNWLNMMYPRLKLAKNLLRDDGLLFVTIDDVEVSHLKQLCNEVFGEENFVSCVVWHKKRGKDNSAQFFSKVHDYILCYAKSIGNLTLNRLELDEDTKKAYRNPDGDARGVYRTLGLWSRGGQGGSRFEFTTKEGQFFAEREWLVGPDTMRTYDQENRLIAVGDKLYRKLFITENEGAIPETIWLDASNNANAADELKVLFGDPPPFDTPKPLPLIQKMIRLGTVSDSIVMDFFAGSGTTGHAVLAENAIDGGTRRYILVQLPEPLDPTDKSQKVAADFCDSLGKPRTVAELTKERLRRAAASIRKESPMFAGDLGFRAFKLDSSNVKPWDADFDTLEQAVYDAVENVKPDRSEQDVLYELLLKFGLDLCVPIEERKIAGKTVFSVGAGALMVCLDKKITLDVVEGIAKLKDELKPEIMRVVFRDSGFKDDVVKTNAVQILKQVGLSDEHIRSI